MTEALFLRRLSGTEGRTSAHVQNVQRAVAQILLHKGALHTAGLAEECFISGRQLERLFHEYIGITPKKLCNLVRYQSVWNDILRNPDFQIQDAVWRYGYNMVVKNGKGWIKNEFKRMWNRLQRLLLLWRAVQRM